MTDTLFGSERTLPMTVAATGFLVDRLGQDCAPLQFLRELTQNSIEAIQATPEKAGDILWDVDWDTYTLTGQRKLCITDTGCGMAGEEMVRYINQLSSSVHEQSMEGNFGVGAKIAAATRNHAGLVYLSWKEGSGATIQLWRDPETQDYGLRQMRRPNGTYGHWGLVEDTVKPKDELVIERHGTKVVLLGNHDGEDTMAAPPGAASPSKWMAHYLNTRYFRFPEGIRVRAREGWEYPRESRDTNLLRTINGQERYLEAHKESSGQVDLGTATGHWWILKDEPAISQNSGWAASAGHIAALFRDELYEMMGGRGGVARLQQFGVIFGYRQVVIYVEPHSTATCRVTSNTARTQLLMNSEGLPWAEWAAEFRRQMPDEISALMEAIVAGSSSSDHRQAIRERLRTIRELFKFARYRPTPAGDKRVSTEDMAGGSSQRSEGRESGGSRSSGGSRGGSGGNIYSLFLTDDGDPATEVQGAIEPDVKWVTVEDGTRMSGVLEDRAAKYFPEQNLLHINGDFRGITALIDRWTEKYAAVPGAHREATDACREWFEQSLVETVMGVMSLKDSREWTIEDISRCLSEEALTAAVMPRYHIDIAVKRALGSKLGTLKA